MTAKISIATALTTVLWGTAALGQSTTSPWELISSGFNGTTKSLDASPASGTLFLGGDVGGAWRSVDCGEHWEPVNGGPGVTEGKSGGYDPSCPANTSCEHGVIYGGPPSINVQELTPMGVVSGPMPTAEGLGGDHLSLRLGRLWWSNDDGAQWYSLAPQCTGITVSEPPPQVRAAAIDAAAPGHIVAAGGSGVWGVDSPDKVASFDASVCPWGQYGNLATPQCAQRVIAWTKDPTAQMLASRQYSNARAWDAPKQMDLAAAAKPGGGGWHFASIAHLAAGAMAAKHACDSGSLPDRKKCTVNKDASCHGAPPVIGAALETACLSSSLDGCFCVDPSSAQCRFPVVVGLAIDPRNGWAYAGTQVGLLVSPDGGRTWGRTGDPVMDRHNDEYAPDGDEDGAAVLRPKARVQLLTGVTPSTDAAENTSAAVADGGTAYDLNRLPHRILDVGPMSLASTRETCPIPLDCPQPAGLCDAAHYADGRPRQHTRAYVSVRWHAVDLKTAEGVTLSFPADAVRSSVFVADADGCADPNASLVFRDTATMFRDASGAHTTDEFDGSHLLLPKLPRSAQYANGVGYYGELANATCPLQVFRVAVAPSDPRIAYAIVAFPFQGPTACAGVCNFADGVYRTLDGGMTWRLIAGAYDPSWAGGEIYKARGLGVSADNPYVAWYLCADTANNTVYRIEPASGGTAQPKVDGCPEVASPGAVSKTNCAACDSTAACVLFAGDSNGWLSNPPNRDGCDKSSVVTNYCQQYMDHNASILGRKADTPCGLPSSSPLLAPPACMHHFPSQSPDDVTSLYGDASASCVSCAPAGCKEQVQTRLDRPPVNCCAVVHQVTKTLAPVCEGGGVTSWQTSGRGGSEEVIYATAMIPVSDGNTTTTTYVTAGGDAPALNAAASAKPAPQTSGDGIGFSVPQWKAKDLAGGLTNVAQLNDVRAVVRDRVGGQPGAWILGVQDVASSDGADAALGFFSLAWLQPAGSGGPPTASVLGRIFAANPSNVYAPVGEPIATSRQASAHISLIDGGPRLYASFAGMGVFSVDKAQAYGATFDPTTEKIPTTVSHLVPGVAYLGDFPTQLGGPVDETQVPGPAVQDVARDGLGHVFSIVGACHYATCAPWVTPGLYVRNESDPRPVWPQAGWRRVASPDLADPYVMKIVRTPTGDDSTLATLLVGSWSLPPANCGGGLYELPLTPANLARLEDPTGATGDPQWRLLMRHDGIVALAATSAPWEVLVGVTGLQYSNTVEHGVGVYPGLAPYPNGNPGAEAGQAPDVAAHRPGVYLVDLASASPTVPGQQDWLGANLPVVAADLVGGGESCQTLKEKLTAAAGRLADCDDRVHKSCATIAGATAATDRPIQAGVALPPDQTISSGLANSLLLPYAIEVSKTTGAAIVATVGNGA